MVTVYIHLLDDHYMKYGLTPLLSEVMQCGTLVRLIKCLGVLDEFELI